MGRTRAPTGGNAAFLQALRQLFSAAMQPRLDSSFGHIHRLGDLGDAELPFVEETEALSLMFGKHIQGKLQFFRQAGMVNSRRACQLPNGFRCRWPPRSFPQVGTTAIRRDFHNPGGEWLTGIPRSQIAQSPHQRFLRRVFRVLMMTQHPKAQCKDRRMIHLHKFVKGTCIAHQAALCEFHSFSRLCPSPEVLPSCFVYSKI